MNKDELMQLIDKKVERDKKEAEQKEMDELLKYTTLKNQIKELTPRIQDLIAVGKHAMEQGIDIDKKGIYLRDISFCADGIYHAVGFMRSRSSFPSNWNYIGLFNGGYNGPIDFYTNGAFTFGINENSGQQVDARIEDMEKFLSTFDEFETAFYGYIERVCK